MMTERASFKMQRKSSLRQLAWLATPIMVLLIAACASSSSGDGDASTPSMDGGDAATPGVDGGSAACAVEHSTKCTPSNDAQAIDFVYGTDALPTGSCSGNATCLMLVDPCADYPAHGAERADSYACQCQDGSWSCQACSIGGGLCIDDGGAEDAK